MAWIIQLWRQSTQYKTHKNKKMVPVCNLEDLSPA